MDHVENIGVEEIVEIFREFVKHGEEVVNKKKTSITKDNHKMIKKNLLFKF
jgi:hypothetical protein